MMKVQTQGLKPVHKVIRERRKDDRSYADAGVETKLERQFLLWVSIHLFVLSFLSQNFTGTHWTVIYSELLKKLFVDYNLKKTISLNQR